MALEFGEKLRNIVRDNAQTMTMIAQARKFMRPDISDYAEDKKTIMAKRRCCHMIIDNNDIKLAVVPLTIMTLLFILVPSLISQTSLLILPSGAIAIGLAYLSWRKKAES